MKLFGEDPGRFGRWYFVLSPVLLLGFLVGLFLLATAGQSQLAAGYDRVHQSQLREMALGEVIVIITGAESAQRGYLLTGETAYLEPFQALLGAVGPALDRLQAAYVATNGDADSDGASTQELRGLAQQKLAALAETVRLVQSGTLQHGDEITRIDSGQKEMDRILTIVRRMRADETTELAAATDRWRRELWWSRAFTAAGAALNIALVMLAIQLIYGDMRRRAQQTTDLRDQKRELERQVAERTRELTSLSTHLQEVSEQEKAALSRELHDELGGLLVAARMDLSWLQQRLPTSDPAIEQRFRRIHESLSAGVDLKRRVVEELRPTLLDNMGLFSALRWQFKETCRRNGLQCTEQIPAEEPRIDPFASIGIFRVGQEALNNILKHSGAKRAHLSVQIDDELFVLEVTDDGRGIAADRLKNNVSHGLTSMRHRVTALGGTWSVECPSSGGTIVKAVFPLERVLLRGVNPQLSGA
jgi:signal transduction histidine kinase